MQVKYMKVKQLKNESFIIKLINRIKNSALFNVLVNPDSGTSADPNEIDDSAAKTIFEEASANLESLKADLSSTAQPANPFHVSSMKSQQFQPHKGNNGNNVRDDRDDRGRELDDD